MLFDGVAIWEEVGRMAAEAHQPGAKFTMGAAIYQQAPHCIHPARLRRPEVDELMSDYRYCKALGVPRAACLDDVPALYADAALILHQEEQAAFAFARSKT